MFTLPLSPFQQELLAVCRGHSFNWGRFKQKFICYLPQIDLFAHPIHQIEKLDFVFGLFRQFAENPSEEICGRFYWTYYEGRYLKEYKGKKCFLDITRCMVTRYALISSIFGIGNKKLHLLKINLKNKALFEEAWRKIQENSSFLKMQPTHFIAYSFGINGTDAFPGHAFLIIQYLNKQGELEYRLFQSYIREYCLSEYLRKNNNIFNSKNFALFLEGLQECLLADIWTHPLEMFYVKYFNVKKGFRIGDVNPCHDAEFTMEWGVGSLVDILIQNIKFQVFKSSPEFPKIEATGSPLFEKIEGDCEKEQPLNALAAKKLRLEKLYKELCEIYDKNEPVATPESLQVDLNLLDLTYSEEGQIVVPARDENGRFIIDEDENVKWVEKIVTLEMVTKEVIWELNKLIHNKSGFTTKDGRRVLVLNVNKEPFITYNNLGVPLDKWTLTPDEEKQLWIRRIIDALVSKGYISKLEKVNGHGYFIEV